jgi:hypothetical protein
MPFLPDLLKKLKNSFSRGPRVQGGSRDKKPPPVRLWEILRRKWPLISLGAALVLLLFLILFQAANRNSPSGPPPAEELSGPARDIRIPREELFLPGEPDFIPGVLLEREQRDAWTAEDAAPYWRDPLKSGEEPWREQAESVIDDLLERAL